MQVQSISSNRNSNTYNQNFSGYTHKSLKKYVKKVVDLECKKMVKDANEGNVAVDRDALHNIYEQGKRIVTKFNNFMEPQHKKTSIELEETGYLKISNPISKTDVPLYMSTQRAGLQAECDEPYIAVSARTGIAMDLPRQVHLDILEQTADDLLNTVNPKEVDKAFLSFAENELKNDAINVNGAGLIGRLKTVYQANKIKDYAYDILAESTKVEDAKIYLDYINAAKINEKIMKENAKKRKNIEKENTKALKDVLSGK